METNSIKGVITINATASKIWNVLTSPDKILLYTGSQTHTDWAVNSPITWEGEMHGTKYANKGKVLESTPNTLLRYTYWSGMGGDKDLPENYSEITYALNPLDNNSVELTYFRIKIATEIETQIFQAHIQSMLDEIKKLSEEALIVKNQIQINAPATKVWEVLTIAKFVRQWDELPEDFNDSSLVKGTEILWRQQNNQFTKLKVTDLVPNKYLKINLYGSKWTLPEKSYDIAYAYALTDLKGTTKLEIEIGDFSVLPDGKNYYDASLDFAQTGMSKIKELSEQG